MKKFNLGEELSKNLQKKVIGGQGQTTIVHCSDGRKGIGVPCASGNAYCSAFTGATMLWCQT